MENFDPVGGGFLVERILDFFSGSFSGGGGRAIGIISGIVAFFKVIFIFFFIAFIFGIIYVVYQLSFFRPGYKIVYKPGQSHKERMGKQRWEEIMKRFQIGNESDYRLAVIEADSLVDEVFKRMGFEGKTLGERIASISPQEVNSISDLKEVHGIRNKIAHTPGYVVSRQDAERSLRIYQKVLEELEAI